MSTSSRLWDRQPETDADRRFFDARESGFRGPIDQDGRPQTPAEHAAWLDQARTPYGGAPGGGAR